MTVQWLDKNRLSKGILAGTFLNLGSATAVEISAGLGFDWLLLDFEHGSGSFSSLRGMLVACHGHNVAPIVRVRSLDPDIVKFVMDSGAAGIMFPYISGVEQAERAVKAMKYPPRGERGVAGVIRATDYGRRWREYFDEANAKGLVVVQIETPEAVDAAEQIAAIDGVDVLFVGPLDLSVNLGAPADFAKPYFRDSLRRVVDACERSGKTAGILSKPGFEDEHRRMGFRLFALSSDSMAIAVGLKQALASIRQ